MVAVLAVVFGVAGSLGMGILQVMAGLNAVLGTPAESPSLMAGLLVGITLAYLASASTSLLVIFSLCSRWIGLVAMNT